MPVQPKKGALPKPKAESERDPEERVLLPSDRVAAFRIPNVGEIVELHEQTVVDASRASDNRTLTEPEIRVALKRAVLRKLLVGLTEHPVAPVLKPGVNLEELRAKAVAESEKALASGSAGLDIDLVMDEAMYAAQDVDAMCKNAPLAPVTDLTWETETGDGYFHKMRTARAGTLEAADWMRLNHAAGDLAVRLNAGAGFSVDPKVLRRALRPTRRSGG